MTEHDDDFGLHTLKPAPGSRRPRKRVGRGEGSGTGKTSGQMPIHMRMRKLRGPHMKKSMPFEMFRTYTQVVNIADLEARFDKGDSVTLDTLHSHGLCTKKGIPVKVLAKGELTKPLTVHAHKFSAAAREAIEGAGGTCQVIE
jgi:large subunit ribosomal protein L15